MGAVANEQRGPDRRCDDKRGRDPFAVANDGHQGHRTSRIEQQAGKALWHSDPIVPRHDPPKVVGGRFPSLADELDGRSLTISKNLPMW